MIGNSVVLLIIDKENEEYEIVEQFGRMTDIHEPVTVCLCKRKRVLDKLDRFQIPYRRERDTVTITNGSNVEDFLCRAMKDGGQDRHIQIETGHPSARVEGYTINQDEQTIDVDYSYIAGV